MIAAQPASDLQSEGTLEEWFRAEAPHLNAQHAEWARKAAAFECHKTQHKDRDFFYDLLKRRAGKEYFHLAIDRTGAMPRGDDLLA